MKTITIAQLEALTWFVESVDVDDHYMDEYSDAVACDADGEPIMATRYQSYVYGACVLRSVEHPEISYTIDWQANGGEESYAAAFDFEVEVNPNGDNQLDTGSIEIVDEDGDFIRPSGVARQICNDIEQSIDWEHEVQKHLPDMPEAQDIDTDTDEDKDMDTIELFRDDGPDVRFQGEKTASASSFEHDGPRNIRWTELALYRTAGGKWVCHEIGCTKWDGERTRRALHIADSEAALIEMVGHGWLAKELYEDAGIDAAVTID